MEVGRGQDMVWVLKRRLSAIKVNRKMFKVGQKVQFGSRWRPFTGVIIAWGASDANGEPRLYIRYYDDPFHFGHPYPIEIEVSPQQVHVIIA